MFAAAPARIDTNAGNLDRVANLAARLLDVPATVVYVYDGERMLPRGTSGALAARMEAELSSLAGELPLAPRKQVVIAKVRTAPPVRWCATAVIPGWDGKAAGILMAAHTEDVDLAEAQLSNFAGLAALAGNEIELERRRGAAGNDLDRRRTQEELLDKTLEITKSGEDLRQLHRLSTTNYESLDELFADYLETGRIILGLEHGLMTRVRGRFGLVEAQCSGADPSCGGTTFELRGIYCGVVAEESATVACTNTSIDYRFHGRSDYGAARPLSYIGSPVMLDGEVYAVLSFSSPRARWGRFNSQEIELMELMAKGVARAIQENRMQRARVRVEALEHDRNLVLEMIVKGRGLPDVLCGIAHMLERQTPFVVAAIHVMNDGKLDCIAAPGLPRSYVRRMQRVLPRTHEHCCFSPAFSGETEVEDDFTAARMLRPVDEFCWHVCGGTPILSGSGELLGLVTIYGKLAERPRRVEAALLEKAAALAAVALDHQHLTDKLAYQAYHDTLTGLPNRSVLLETLAAGMAAHKNDGCGIAVAFIDLDRFKQINDSFGHSAGDAVLCATAARLRDCLGAGEMAARIGGDEFVVMLTDVCGEDDALLRAAQMLELLREPVLWKDEPLCLTASIGVSLCSQFVESAEDLLAGADAAMYRVKNSGRNDVLCGAPELSADRWAKLEIEHALRHAIAREELTLSFQPIWNIQHKGRATLDSFEALLSWNHPVMGRIPPAQFIPVAEECGLIVHLGNWVLRKACAQAVAWAGTMSAPVRISVNVSALQFARPDFVDLVSAALRESGLKENLLELEFTESAIMQDLDTATAKLVRLRALGVRLSLDDFGTGYSSLGYLRWIPVDTLKIDRSFVCELGKSPGARTLVETILSMARNMKLNVIAEGVETSQQLEMLGALGCGMA
ncbi:MAG: sensor domain-containing phosphodiesterase, partial [Candidatus Solibacter usitatus]|nr:sensor domain-containing phosphodiesterase [Candidatus Solibacter usitatus]